MIVKVQIYWSRTILECKSLPIFYFSAPLIHWSRTILECKYRLLQLLLSHLHHWSRTILECKFPLNTAIASTSFIEVEPYWNVNHLSVPWWRSSRHWSRTILECKLEEARKYAREDLDWSRTILECKLRCNVADIIPIFIEVEPYWNVDWFWWLCIKYIRMDWSRTILECKWMLLCHTHDLHYYWSRTILECKCGRCIGIQYRRYHWSRTILECKFKRMSKHSLPVVDGLK